MYINFLWHCILLSKNPFKTIELVNPYEKQIFSIYINIYNRKNNYTIIVCKTGINAKNKI